MRERLKAGPPRSPDRTTNLTAEEIARAESELGIRSGEAAA